MDRRRLLKLLGLSPAALAVKPDFSTAARALKVEEPCKAAAASVATASSDYKKVAFVSYGGGFSMRDV